MNNRDARGRFLPGCKSGPGRPSRASELAYLNATLATVTIQDWVQVIQKALDQAKEGDARARDFLASYLLPKGWQGTVSETFVGVIDYEAMLEQGDGN